MENGSECTRSIDYELEISMRVIDDEGAARVSYVNHLRRRQEAAVILLTKRSQSENSIYDRILVHLYYNIGYICILL